MMKAKVDKEGPAAKLKMALAINRGERMIERYLNKLTIPRPEIASALAKACGATEQVALEISKESYLERSKDKKSA